MINQPKEFKFIGIKKDKNHKEKIKNKIKLHIFNKCSFKNKTENWWKNYRIEPKVYVWGQ